MSKGIEHKTNQLAYGECPQCGSHMQMKFVGKNSFLGCTAYPTCDYSQSVKKQDVEILKVMHDSHCPECDAELAVKKGRYGMFIGCTDFPNCHFISSNQATQHSQQNAAHNKSNTNTTNNEGESQSPNTHQEYKPVTCQSCNKGRIQKKQNRFGKFFYACDAYPKCKQIFNQEPIERSCEQCRSSIMLVKSRGEDVFICANSKCAHVINENKDE